MATTETILSELREQLAEAVAAGKSTAERDVRQQIIAHETLARLRAEHAAKPGEGLASQIRMWQRQLWRDAEPESAPKAKRQRANTAEPPTDSTGEQA